MVVARTFVYLLLSLCAGQRDGSFHLPVETESTHSHHVMHEDGLLLQMMSEANGESSSEFDAVSIADLTRAHQSFPSAQFTANSATEINAMLNRHLKSGKLSMPRAQPCQEFSLKELGLVQQQLAMHGDQRLWSFASSRSRAPRHDNAAELAVDVAYWDEYAQRHTDVTEALRDGRCHEVALQWVHHLTDSARLAISKSLNVSLPLLPKNPQNYVYLFARHPKVKTLLSVQASCQTAHNSEPSAYNRSAEWPVWPNELTYEATGYGVYPFWKLDGLVFDPDIFHIDMTKNTHLHVHYSATHNQARYDHSACHVLPKNLTFQELPLKLMPTGPCTNLFLSDGTGFLYSQVGNETFCCMASRPLGKGPCKLTAVPPNFIDKLNFIHDFNYSAESGSYVGLAKLYALRGPDTAPVWFWYVTTPDGIPLEQGEGYCLMYGPAGTRECTDEESHGHAFSLHQYHPETMQEWVYDSKIFDVPEFCMGEIGNCGAQPPTHGKRLMCALDYDAGYNDTWEDIVSYAVDHAED